MSQLLKELTIVVICLTSGICFSVFLLPRHGEVVYNCSIAEISPDFPVTVREQCRKLKMDKIK